MFSEALEILDRNTANYMIDELAQEVKSVKEELDSARKESMAKDNLIDTQKNELATKDEEITKLKAQIDVLKHNK